MNQRLLTRKDLRKWKSSGLERLIENSPYRDRGDAIGNDEIIADVFMILHQRGESEIDCETAYCFENCEEPK